MLLFPDFLTHDEHHLLTTCALQKLKRTAGRDYVTGHFDNVISNYRECSVSSLHALLSNRTKLVEEGKQTILDQIGQRMTQFFPRDVEWLPFHILDLDKDGCIKPHVDNVEYSGGVIVGLCLMSERVLQLTRVDKPDHTFSVYLPPRALYIQKERVRYDYTHQIEQEWPAQDFGAALDAGLSVIGGKQRLAILLRVSLFYMSNTGVGQGTFFVV